MMNKFAYIYLPNLSPFLYDFTMKILGFFLWNFEQMEGVLY